MHLVITFRDEMKQKLSLCPSGNVLTHDTRVGEESNKPEECQETKHWSHETTHDVLPDGEQGLGREQVLDPVLDVGLGDLDLGDHELDLLLADPAQVPVGGRQESGGKSVMRKCYEIVTNCVNCVTKYLSSAWPESDTPR